MPPVIREAGFTELFTQDLPLIDLRAPIEYQHGAFPSAVNLPLLSDAQRHAVGKQFKRSGQDAAIALANELLGVAEKEQRIASWISQLEDTPTAAIYCFRGGLRSQTVQQWLRENGVEVPLIEGGYKALRRFLITTVEASSASSKFIIVGGKTGSAKTHLINALDYSIDLEGLANHRGSAFGRRIDEQPTQIEFENRLGIALLKLPYQQTEHIFLEDESRAIGSLSIPKLFYEKMGDSPIAMLEESLAARVETIYSDYIYSNFEDFRQRDLDGAQDNFSAFLLGSLERIQRRLGGEKYAQIRQTMESALTHADAAEAEALHREWIETLLCDYYDPMYDYQMNKKLDRVIYRGSKEEFTAWASHLNRQP